MLARVAKCSMFGVGQGSRQTKDRVGRGDWEVAHNVKSRKASALNAPG
jgi:hypothetical protein